jgi:hypothetical protein
VYEGSSSFTYQDNVMKLKDEDFEVEVRRHLDESTTPGNSRAMNLITDLSLKPIDKERECC